MTTEARNAHRNAIAHLDAQVVVDEFTSPAELAAEHDAEYVAWCDEMGHNARMGQALNQYENWTMRRKERNRG